MMMLSAILLIIIVFIEEDVLPARIFKLSAPKKPLFFYHLLSKLLYFWIYLEIFVPALIGILV